MIVLFFLGLVTSCNEDDKTVVTKQQETSYVEMDGKKVKIILGPNTQNNFIILNDNVVVKDDFVLPKGTRISKIKDDPYSFSFELPSDYILAGATKSIEIAQGNVTCKCTKGTGCSPFVSTISQQTIGCLMNDQCTACTKTVSARIGVEQIEINNPQVVDLTKGVHFVTDKSELSDLKCINAEILDIKRIQDDIRKFVNAYQVQNTEQLYMARNLEEIPANYEYVTLSAYGRAMLVPIDRTVALFLTNPLTNDGYVPRARVAATHSCKCNSGTVGCTKGSKSIPLVGAVIYCEAGRCTDCTLIYR